MAKNQVAPIKGMTLPQLELMAAVLGAHLGRHLLDELELERVVYWSDSQIVIHWLSSEKQQNKFIKNRRKEINDLTGSKHWRYVPTHSNPADLQTRGISAKEFEDNTLWFHGPPWITQPQSWPVWKECDTTVLSAIENTETENCSETAKDKRMEPTSNVMDIVQIERFNSYQKLLRVTAYVIRFVDNLRKREDRNQGKLTAGELQRAANMWIRDIQHNIYSTELECLRSRTQHHLIRQLKLYIDPGNMLRCGGRINNAPIPTDAKFPLLLPGKHKFTHLLIQDTHQRNCHAGTGTVVTLLRQRVWIPAARQIVRSVLRKCVSCKKVSGKPYLAPAPPPLPKDRMLDSEPFSVTGVDFTGELHVKSANGRDKKVYICLFTCANTRAVHLEIVPDLTEESFLRAFRRFISRKSLPKIMMSDNATTFVSAAENIRRLSQSVAVTDTLCQAGTVWKFIPKRAPWYGGYWERLTGITKDCIKKVLGCTYM
ncbi:uncharacterized protein [Argopecten irradians]|uniref:uncharacterized protein n=1 Tax=Argopecten irradians TaxID=31199 RepID=UPI00371C0E38